MKRRPIVAGNWKMHKTTKETEDTILSLKNLISDVFDREIVICPPFTALYSAISSAKGSNIKIGAQNMYFEEKGAFTGEVSPIMIKDLGCEYVIIGHSERRQYFYETDNIVNRKVVSAIKHLLTPIVCIGETLQERETNKTFQVVETQIHGAFKSLSSEQMVKCVIAYEPVWAIGTGKTATKEQAQEVHSYIRHLLSKMFSKDVADQIRILYGGSVKPENMADLMSQPDIDGALVGGASLEAESFSKIIKY